MGICRETSPTVAILNSGINLHCESFKISEIETMKTINKVLHIDASPRGDRSTSRKLGNEFIRALTKKYPDLEIIYRDLRETHFAPMTEAWVAASFSIPQDRTEEQKQVISHSDLLVSELIAADLILIDSPMHNFSVPFALKAWLDNVIRPGVTFTVGDDPTSSDAYIGLLSGKHAVVINSVGGSGYEENGANAAYNYFDGLLRTCFGFMGVIDVEIIRCENMSGDPELREKSYQEALSKVISLAN